MTRYASVILDIPTRALDEAFDYRVPDQLLGSCAVGCSVLVSFARRAALGYVVGLSPDPPSGLDPAKIKDLQGVLSVPCFTATHYELARWISHEYVSPLSETLRLFTPPGSSHRLRKGADGGWQLEAPDVGPVDDRWVALTEEGRNAQPPARAKRQRALLEVLRAGELKVSELALAVEQPATPLRALEQKGWVRIDNRRRIRGLGQPGAGSIGAPVGTEERRDLTVGQRQALDAILESLGGGNGDGSRSNGGGDSDNGSDGGGSGSSDDAGCPRPTPASGDGATARPRPTPASGDAATPPAHRHPRPILLDGVTGSGKTEVYLQAIRHVLDQGGSAIVLVPEISLTPQMVARFRSRFGEQVAVLHSRLSVGERYDQWDLLRTGVAQVVVGARSALFAPLPNLSLIIIDEEHEGSYKQGSAPRYHARDVASKLAQLTGATLVLGSATPSLESLEAARTGRLQLIELPERVNHRPLPNIQVVDLAQEFRSGNKTMFSAALSAALLKTMQNHEKAVLLLNKRGFASFLLCRDCGYVPMCENCATSMTYHEHPPQLVCHHCDAHQAVPAVCPSCGSPYLKQLGPGTQFAYDQLAALLPAGTPIVRMDADTTRGRYGHERCLEEFMAADHGVLLGTQMIAKGLDFPEVTLVGVLIADTALKLPDFRASERTYQLLEQVAGRAGRAAKDGRVIVQTYWPEHVAIRAAAAHDRSLLLDQERALRSELGYPPYSRLANILIWGPSLGAVREHSEAWSEALREQLPTGAGWQVLGPSPCVLARRQGQHRWHLLVRAPVATTAEPPAEVPTEVSAESALPTALPAAPPTESDLPGLLSQILAKIKPVPDVNRAIDIDPYDLI